MSNSSLHELRPWSESDDAISAVSGEFINASVEDAYLQSTWDDLAKRIKTSAWIALVFSVLSTFLDHRYLGFGSSFVVLAIARFLGLVPLHLLGFRAAENNSRHAILQSSLWAMSCVFTSVLASVYILPEATLLSALWICVLLMGNYIYVPHHFKGRLGSSLYLSIGFILISAFHTDVQKEHFLSATILLTFTNVMGAQFSRALEGFRRKEASLLQNLLPTNVIQNLKLKKVPIDLYPETSILFADLVGFTRLAMATEPRQLVDMLNQLFSEFDRVARTFRVQKIKTIGDCYMAASGLPASDPHHAETLVAMAIEMRRVVRRFIMGGKRLHLRIGIHSGPVIAGVIGIDRPFFDVWGDTVNIASRMESHGLPDEIHVSESTYQLTRKRYRFEGRGPIDIRHGGLMKTYLLRRG